MHKGSHRKAHARDVVSTSWPCIGLDDVPRTPPVSPGHLLPFLDLYRPGRDEEPAPGEL